jgi:tRNA (guanine-N7-)-methyltransferase
MLNTDAEYTPEGKYKRQIRSFVLREGRLTQGQQRALDEHWDHYGVDYQAEPLDFTLLFKRQAPVVLEIGFGMGKSLIEMAQAEPEKDFIGIEVHKPGVGACIQAASEAGVKNLKVIHHDAVEVLQKMIPDGSLHALQLFFADPWHKKKHHKRRIVQIPFVELVASRLEVGGFFHLATDWMHYAEHILEVLPHVTTLKNTSATGDFIPRPQSRPYTKFEQRGQNLGHGVWDLMYQKL